MMRLVILLYIAWILQPLVPPLDSRTGPRTTGQFEVPLARYLAFLQAFENAPESLRISRLNTNRGRNGDPWEFHDFFLQNAVPRLHLHSWYQLSA